MSESARAETKKENTKLTCPDCGGALEKITEGNLLQYRCRVGHLYSPQTALAVHAEREENMLWSATVILQEGADLAEEVAGTQAAVSPEQLREAAKIKRELSERMRNIALDFGKISLGAQE